MRYRFIGDTILTVPFLRNLRRSCPDARIDVLVGPQSGQVLENCPYVDELIEFDTTRFHKYDSGGGARLSYWHYAKMLRKRKYDTVFVLKRSVSSAFLAFLTGAKHRIGYSTEGRSLLLTHGVKWDKHIHEVDSLLSVLNAAGVPVKDNQLESFTTESERQKVYDLVPSLQDKREKLLVHAAAAHPDKMYPLDSWADVIKTLVGKTGFRVYFTGAKRDYELYQSLIEKTGIECVNLAGKLSLRESICLYEKMSLAVCVDSGPAHLAAAAGVPTVSIFGPTDPLRWGPYGKMHATVAGDRHSCPACRQKRELTRHECLTGLPPERIIAAALETARQSSISSISP